MTPKICYVHVIMEWPENKHWEQTALASSLAVSDCWCRIWSSLLLETPGGNRVFVAQRSLWRQSVVRQADDIYVCILPNFWESGVLLELTRSNVRYLTECVTFGLDLEEFVLTFNCLSFCVWIVIQKQNVVK